MTAVVYVCTLGLYYKLSSTTPEGTIEDTENGVLNNYFMEFVQRGRIRDSQRKGKVSRLSEDQKKRLKKILEEGSSQYGYDTDLWTLKGIAEIIEHEFHVHYNVTYIWQILDRMGYSA